MENNLHSTQNDVSRMPFLLKEASRLSSSVIWDCGRGNVFVINHSFTNYTPQLKLIGPAYPVSTNGDILPIIQAINDISPGFLLVINDSISKAALLGDIIMLAAKKKNVSGILCSGIVRDVADASNLEMPLWALNAAPNSCKLGVASPTPSHKVEIAKQEICFGDWLFGDRDGLVCLPAKYARLVIKSACIKNKKENNYKNRIYNGENLFEMMNIEAHIARGENIKVEF